MSNGTLKLHRSSDVSTDNNSYDRMSKNYDDASIVTTDTNLLIILMKTRISSNDILDRISEIWTNVLDFFGQAWWVEVVTNRPRCTYYFGPFADAEAANRAIMGYIQDLENESAQGIQTQIKRCKPDRLTIEWDDAKAV
ncbi:DUF1816 domain-containing protein [Chamaesiphon minutus]|uniref:Uncharacterized protein n=1 Tax=Chamaesiphon minutus (strain ATCC 27169 / PCC 6605) TaxID=1173020 RepID=K9UR62_CHAP6|nr:DUF1816 domain-containing protein [Chamaesiphon minutus]AFY96739.1 protein of unknown function (DUF1816) [Chamaesiphon minutus PCC 6605]